MAGISDLPYRSIGRRAGCALAYTEMASARALCESNKKTLRILDTSPEDAPLAVQLFGRVPGELGEACRIVEETGAALVDLNAGCPARKVVRSGCGSALLENLPLLGRLVEAMRAATRLPLTVKLRAGPGEGRIVALEAARICREAGADAVALHPRTKTEGFSGRADLSLVGRAARDLDIPVIGSGDVFEPADALRMLDLGAAAVMVARGGLGNPWLIGRALTILEGRPDPGPPDLGERFGTLLAHLALVVRREGETRAVVIMRKHMGWYVKGLPGAAALRRRLFSLTEVRQVEEALRDYEEPGCSLDFKSSKISEADW